MRFTSLLSKEVSKTIEPLTCEDRINAHRCDVAIALYQKYCGCGIGKIMLQKVLEVAKNVGYEQAELEVISDNYKAISLYKELGFEKCGHFPNNMKYADGKYADADWMMKKL